MKAEIFTTPTCIKCKRLKEQLAEGDYGLEIEMIDASTPEGLEKAKERNITTVPTVYIFDAEGKELGVGHDIDDIENILKK